MKKILLIVFLSFCIISYPQSTIESKVISNIGTNYPYHFYENSFLPNENFSNSQTNKLSLPSCVNLISPINESTNVNINYLDLIPIPTTKILYTNLNFSLANNDPDPTTGLKFKFGTNISNLTNFGTLPFLMTNVSVGVIYNTTYYWQIIPTSILGDAIGCPIYSFTTGVSPGFCFNGALSPTETFSPTICDGITQNIISNNDPLGHYANINVIAGQTYKFESSVSTDNLTISDQNGINIKVFGTSPLTMTATNSEIVRFYTHINNQCNETITSTNRIRTVVCGNSLASNNYIINRLELYPNPIKDILNLSFDQKKYDISIVNYLGQEVFFRSITNFDAIIDMSNFASGNYIVKLISENEFRNLKVIKE